MIPLNDDMIVNKFIDVKLPTKRQIFGRLGASAPGVHYSGDDSVDFGMKPTEMADALVSAAENFVEKDDLPEDVSAD